MAKCVVDDGPVISHSPRCGIFVFCLLLFPQNKRKIYKLRQTKLSQFVYFSLVLREQEETKTKYSAPVANLTEISGSKLDVKKTGVAVITTRLVGIMAESLVSNFGKDREISESFFFSI